MNEEVNAWGLRPSEPSSSVTCQKDEDVSHTAAKAYNLECRRATSTLTF